MIRQVSPLASAVAEQLVVPFSKPTLRDAILVAAFRLPRAALASVCDDAGTSWSLINVATSLTGKLEVWQRWPAGLRGMKSHPLMPETTWWETSPGPAGVKGVTAAVCNGLVLPLSGLAIECRRATKFGDAVEALHELLSCRPQQSVIREAG